MQVDDVDVAEIEIAHGDQRVDPSEDPGRLDAHDVDSSPVESLLLVGRYVRAPDGDLVSPPDQLPAYLLDVLVPPSDVGPVPDVSQEYVQGPARVHVPPTEATV